MTVVISFYSYNSKKGILTADAKAMHLIRTFVIANNGYWFSYGTNKNIVKKGIINCLYSECYQF